MFPRGVRPPKRPGRLRPRVAVVPARPPGPIPQSSEAGALGLRAHRWAYDGGVASTTVFPCGLARWWLFQYSSVGDFNYNNFFVRLGDSREETPFGVPGLFLRPGNIFRSFTLVSKGIGTVFAAYGWFLTGDNADAYIRSN
jgi:hypothetical protein